MNSKPENWEFSSERIALQKKDGRDSIRAGLRELEARGYLVRVCSQLSNGKFDWDYELYAEPVEKTVDGFSVDGKPDDGKPDDGKPVPNSNKEKEKKNSKKDTVREKATPPSRIQLKIDCENLVPATDELDISITSKIKDFLELIKQPFYSDLKALRTLVERIVEEEKVDPSYWNRFISFLKCEIKKDFYLLEDLKKSTVLRDKFKHFNNWEAKNHKVKTELVNKNWVEEQINRNEEYKKDKDSIVDSGTVVDFLDFESFEEYKAYCNQLTENGVELAIGSDRAAKYYFDYSLDAQLKQRKTVKS